MFTEVLGGYSVIYSSGCFGYFAAMMYYNPKKILMGQNYHGCVAISNILKRNGAIEKYTLDDIKEFVEKGNNVHLEITVNPYGMSSYIRAFANRAHEKVH